MKKYLNQQDMKDRNYTNVFRLIRKKGPLTRRQIESETGLSWGAVSNVTARLIELGYVHECREVEGGTPSTAGRTPIYLEADGGSHFVIGMDVNCSGLRAVMMNLRGDPVATVSMPSRYGDREELLSAIFELTREILDYADGKHVLCIGVALQGTVDAENGVSVHFPRCRDWKDVPLAAILEETFGLPIYLEHDPNCTLYAYSAPSGIDEAILVRIDRGIGMALLLGGRIFERFGAFELGHTVVHPGGALCSCGNRGCLEAYASMTGIAENAGVSFEELATRARAGDADAVGRFTEMAESLAVSISNVARLLNVRAVVLSGDMLLYRDLFYGRLADRTQELSGDLGITYSVTDVAGTALGGAMIALERYALRLES